MKNWFIIYNTQYNPIKWLSLEQKGKLLDRIFLYNIWENIESWDAVIEMAFWFFKQQFEMDNKKYQETVVERNKINGSKWGRPKKEKETQENPKNPVGLKKADNDNDKDNDNVKDNNINIISKDIIQKQSFWNEEINNLQDIIKNEVLSIWLIYKSWKYERERIKNILTAKEFGQTCELAQMTRQEFCLNLIKLTQKLEFWYWKIYNWETLYKHYAQVYNEAVRLKEWLKQKQTPTLIIS